MKNHQFNMIAAFLFWNQSYQIPQDWWSIALKVVGMFYMIAACIQKWKDN